MKNLKNNFEQELQNKMNQLADDPSDTVWHQLNGNLPKATATPSAAQNWVMIGLAALAGAILFGLFYTFLRTETMPIKPAEKPEAVYASDSSNPLKIERIATAKDLMAKADKNIMMINFDMNTCPICAKMELVTLENEAVLEFLGEHFVQVDVERTEPEFDFFRKNYGINAFPTMAFFNENGQLIDLVRGFRDAETFTGILERMMEKEAAGEYIELEPLLERKEKIKDDKATSLQLNIYPNPNDGQFEIDIKGEKAPLTIRFIELDGKEIRTNEFPNFSGKQTESYSFSAYSGQMILQVIQNGETVSEKVMIQ